MASSTTPIKLKYHHPLSTYVTNKSWCCYVTSSICGLVSIFVFLTLCVWVFYGLSRFAPEYQTALQRRTQDQQDAARDIDRCSSSPPPNPEMINCKHIIYSYNMNVNTTALFDALAVVYGTGTSNIYPSSTWFCGSLCLGFLTTISQSSVACVIALCILAFIVVLASFITVYCVYKSLSVSDELRSTPPPYVPALVDIDVVSSSSKPKVE